MGSCCQTLLLGLAPETLDTLEKIASEKAGIIKDNAPVVIGKRNALTDLIFIKKASENNTPLLFAEDCYQDKIIEASKGKLTVHMTRKTDSETQTFTTSLAGLYQAENIRTVLRECFYKHCSIAQ